MALENLIAIIIKQSKEVNMKFPIGELVCSIKMYSRAYACQILFPQHDDLDLNIK